MYTISAIINNPKAKETLWYWYLANLDNFEKLPSFHYQRALIQLIPKCEAQAQDVKEFFVDYIKKKPDLGDTLDVGLETLEINLQFKRSILG